MFVELFRVSQRHDIKLLLRVAEQGSKRRLRWLFSANLEPPAETLTTIWALALLYLELR